MRAALAGGLLVASALTCGTAIDGCAPMPPDDCASRNRCAPGDDGGADVQEDRAPSDASAEADATMMTTADADAAPPVDGPSTKDAPDRDASVGDASDAGDAALDAGDGFDGFVCDPTLSPRNEPCLVNDLYGVFVSPTGGDNASGAMNDPVRTISEGVAKATQTSKARVFVCAGTYPESLRLASPVNVYGSFACDAGWPFSDGGGSHVSGVENRVTLTVDGVTSAVSIEDLLVAAPDGSGMDDAGNGASSIAALVSGSNVTFRRCSFAAGAGAPGLAGSTGTNYADATAPSGAPGDGLTPGSGGSVTCNDMTNSTGGAGGALGADGGSGSANPLPPLNTAQALDGVGGMGSTNRCSSGDPGAAGLSGDAGSAASVAGQLSATGWIPSGGGAGQSGSPGQGGGGGGGAITASTGGGAGGCGGAGGTGGSGGGASIAVALLGSMVTFDSCMLVTSIGGNGGAGGPGEPGQMGGSSAPSPGPGCSGNVGGNGGGGGGGGGGPGGPSVCVLYRGGAPIGPIVCTRGPAGQGGAGGQGGGPAPAAPNGADGGAGPTGDSVSMP